MMIISRKFAAVLASASLLSCEPRERRDEAEASFPVEVATPSVAASNPDDADTESPAERPTPRVAASDPIALSFESRTVRAWIVHYAEECRKEVDSARAGGGTICFHGGYGPLNRTMENFGPEAIPRAIQAMATENAGVSHCAHMAVCALIRTKEDIATVAGFLADEDPRVRDGVIGVFIFLPNYGSFEYSAAVSVLRDLVSHPVAQVRADAIDMLGWIREPAHSAIPEIRKAINDPHAIVRLASVKALQRLGEKVEDSIVPYR